MSEMPSSVDAQRPEEWMAEEGNRCSIRLQGYDYSSEGAYFLTICVQDRQPLFGAIQDSDMVLNEFGRHVLSVWRDLSNRYPGVLVDDFVVMPDHVHGMVVIDAIGSDPVGRIQRESDMSHRRRMTISRLVGRFKMNTAKWINEQRNTRGRSVWQRNYHDHIVRNDDELERIRAYIAQNPRRWWEKHLAGKDAHACFFG